MTKIFVHITFLTFFFYLTTKSFNIFSLAETFASTQENQRHIPQIPTIISGKSILDDQKNILVNWSKEKQGTVVIFLSSTCPCSQSHLPHLNTLSNTYSEFQFLGIHSNKDENLMEVKNYFRSQKVSFPLIQDKNFYWANLFRAYKTPHAFVINSTGKIVYKGSVSSSTNVNKAEYKYLKLALQSLKDKTDIKNPRTRVLGCEISRN